MMTSMCYQPAKDKQHMHAVHKALTLSMLQAELANQIDPLMLRVLEKCQKHRDQVHGCQVRHGSSV